MVIRKALAVLRAQAGHEGDEGDVDDGVLLATLARVTLRDGDTPERPMPDERYRVVLEKCPTCQRVTHVRLGQKRLRAAGRCGLSADVYDSGASWSGFWRGVSTEDDEVRT